MVNSPSSDRDFEQALRFLANKMPDAYTLPKPTLLHSVRVGIYLYGQDYDSSISIAGLLHDLVEDADVTVEEIKKEFGEKVGELVAANTKDDSLSEKKRYEELINRCIEHGEAASIIKAADIIDNLLTYKKTNNEEGIKNMISFGNMLLSLKPKSYKDIIFLKLKELL